MPNFEECEHRFIPLSKLKVHPQVQRRFDETWARKIASAFDPDAFGELLVVRHDGLFYIIDGQHRAFAARQALGEEQTVPCQIFDEDVMGVARSAAIFVKRNSPKLVRPMDLFKQRCRAGDQVALGVMGVLARYHLKLDDQRKKGSIKAVTGALSVYRNGAGAVLFDRTIRALYAAWGGDPDAYASPLLRGLALVLERFGADVDDHDLAHKMAAGGAPIEHIGMARTMARGHACSVDRAMAQHIIGIYNKGRRNRLPGLDELAA